MTNNNQYFERNMLINAEKTNQTLESNDWQPTKELIKINKFLDISGATNKKQDVINQTLINLLGNNATMEKGIAELNQKLLYQNSRPPGIGSDDIWLPTQLLQEIISLLEVQNDIQEETSGSKEIGILNDISNNTGAAIPLLGSLSEDISKNTFIMETLLSDNSKNLISLINDSYDNNIDNSKNLINIKNEIINGNNLLSTISTTTSTTSTNTSAISTNTSTTSSNTTSINNNLYNATAFQPWLETINTNLLSNTSTLNNNLYDPSGRPWLKTLWQTNFEKTATITTTFPNESALGNWTLTPGGTNIYPPKKITLFIEVTALPLATDHIDIYGAYDNPPSNWYLIERLGANDFNPLTSGGTVPLCTFQDPNFCKRIARNFDYFGVWFKVQCGPIAPNTPTTLQIQNLYAIGI